ncbi:MAG: hypothetical protein EB060_10615 [Proteobacteria bacterium]|nr:hypothetical protein [Pseudomonadota bacterium]
MAKSPCPSAAELRARDRQPSAPPPACLVGYVGFRGEIPYVGFRGEIPYVGFRGEIRKGFTMPDTTKEAIDQYIDTHLPGAAHLDIRRYTLYPTKDAPLTFTGQLLADSNSKTSEGMARLCWYELAVFCTTTGKSVLQIAFRSLRRPQDEFVRVFWDALPEGLRQLIADYDEMDWVQGFPREEKYAVRQQRFEHEVRFHFRRAATQLFRSLSDQYPNEFIRKI